VERQPRIVKALLAAAARVEAVLAYIEVDPAATLVRAELPEDELGGRVYAGVEWRRKASQARDRLLLTDEEEHRDWTARVYVDTPIEVCGRRDSRACTCVRGAVRLRYSPACTNGRELPEQSAATALEFVEKSGLLRAGAVSRCR